MNRSALTTRTRVQWSDVQAFLSNYRLLNLNDTLPSNDFTPSRPTKNEQMVQLVNTLPPKLLFFPTSRNFISHFYDRHDENTIICLDPQSVVS